MDGKIVRYLVSLIALLLSSACMRQDQHAEEQAALLRDLAQHQTTIMQATAHEVDRYIDVFQNRYKQLPRSRCTTPATSLATIYLPKSAPHNREVDCLLQSVAPLEHEWKTYFSQNNTLSWAYFYDNNSKLLVLYPQTNARSTFGDDLTFETFRMYKIPAASYPQGAWIASATDVSGTGKIITYGKAIKLAGKSQFTVTCIDISANRIIQPFEEKILAMAQKHQLKHVFLISYQPGGSEDSIAYEFSTNQEQWRSIKSFNGEILQLDEAEKENLRKAEIAVKTNATTDLQQEISINNKRFNCNMHWFENVSSITLLCSQK